MARARGHNRPVKGGRFIHEVRGYLRDVVRERPMEGISLLGQKTDAPAAARIALAALDDPATKRMVINPGAYEVWSDRQQAKGELYSAPYRLPFEQMWIEFTEAPRLFPEESEADEEAYPDDDLLGILVHAGADMGDELTDTEFWVTPLTFVFRQRHTVAPEFSVPGYSDKTFLWRKETGDGYTRYKLLVGDVAPNNPADIWDVPRTEAGVEVEDIEKELWGKNDHSSFSARELAVLDELSKRGGKDGRDWRTDAMTAARPPFEDVDVDSNRRRGLWERFVYAAATSFDGLLEYMTDTSVIIVEEGLTLSRQQKRYAQRKGKPDHVPEVFHLVYARSRHERVHPSGGERHLSYRFDVRGHYRRPYSRKGKDGKSYTVKGSWVTPHQKGPGIYIPSTHVFEGS